MRFGAIGAIFLAIGRGLAVHGHDGRVRPDFADVGRLQSLVIRQPAFNASTEISLPGIFHQSCIRSAGNIPPVHLRQTNPGAVIDPSANTHVAKVMLNEMEAEQGSVVRCREKVGITDRPVGALPAGSIDVMEELINRISTLEPQL